MTRATIEARIGGCIVMLCCLCASRAVADNWPRFRGPTGQGMSDDRNVPLRWSNTENVAWKTPLPGQGWSSPVVWGDQVWLTTATEDGKESKIDETAKKLLEGDIKERPAATIAEGRRFLEHLTGKPLSNSTVRRLLKRLGFSRKKGLWGRWRETSS